MAVSKSVVSSRFIWYTPMCVNALAVIEILYLSKLSGESQNKNKLIGQNI